MEKLIKLLFPKTYQAIYNKGYNDCADYYFGEPDYYAEPEYDDFHLYDYEEDDIEPIVTIPNMKVGDMVHLYSKKGVYTVAELYADGFDYTTRKWGVVQFADYQDYKCHAGGMFNKRE